MAVQREHVSIETDAGFLSAKAVILAVPARMLESGVLRISPGLPSAIENAFHDVPMGWYEKIAIGFDGSIFENEEVSYADIFDRSPPTPGRSISSSARLDGRSRLLTSPVILPAISNAAGRPR